MIELTVKLTLTIQLFIIFIISLSIFLYYFGFIIKYNILSNNNINSTHVLILLFSLLLVISNGFGITAIYNYSNKCLEKEKIKKQVI